MRVVHISTYDIDGGAARAAFRLHEALRAAGQDSTMLVRTKHSQSESVQQLVSGNGSNRLFGELIQDYYINQNRTTLSTTCFTLGWPGEDLTEHPLLSAADIIHLHWVSGLLSASSIASLQRLGKPIVWTLHDQRAFTGGCHYSCGCQQYQTNCAACTQLIDDRCRLTGANLADQVHHLAALPITIIAPSRWMAQCARRSAVFSSARIEVIPYGIDTDRFQAVPQPAARARLVLPEDDFLLLFGVDNAGEKRKGLSELFTVLEACASDDGFRKTTTRQRASLLCFGEFDIPSSLSIPVRTFGRIRSDDILSSLYSAADVFLLPSLEDNLPNTVLESMSCGTPVGAFSVGGVPDMVIENQTGFLAPTGDLAGLARMIVNNAQDPQKLRGMRPACRRHIETHFTYSQHANACLAVYEDLLRQTRRSAVCGAGNELRADVADPGLHLQRAFAPILKHVLDAHPEALTPSGTLAQVTGEKRRHQELTRQVKRILKRAVRKPWPYARVRAALERELSILAGDCSWWRRPTLFLRPFLRIFSRNRGPLP